MTDLIARLKASQIELCRLAADELERLTPTDTEQQIARFWIAAQPHHATAALLRKYVLREKT